MQDLIMQRLQRYGVDVPKVAWAQLDDEAANRQLYLQAGLTGIEHSRNQVGYYFNNANDWWDVVWWAGFRGFVNQIPAGKAAQFKREHLAEVDALATEDGLFFNVEVIHTIGRKPL